MNIEEIKKIAKLARIEIPENQLEDFAGEFNKILEYFKKLDSAPTEGVEPFLFEEANVWRDDRHFANPAAREIILANAPEKQGDFFKVKKVLE
ncbi:Asp-tRNA(Asn)/Glu-tRNA(Gln) amidotransferase subunit GatC [bacterium]|nr:Asp-tRNA(Asn)/Glu-tRNA(Gln) amidotransferase subunit GatC [bacterium]MBU3955414.1 Asp-tRNA(Asn)/Glu-tRNA(Gln) amidotransferase subunit GatC [bacterium]